MFGTRVREGVYIVAALMLGAQTAAAQITEHREGAANPMVEVFKSTIYGGAAGLLLGLAVELVDDEGDGEPVKWGFVAGTFFGFGYGLYHVATRPEPGALLERDAGRWVMAAPDVTVDPARAGVRIELAAVRF